MPDAWEILKAASPSIINGDAWTRLNNLETGGEVIEVINYNLQEGLEVELDMHCVEVEIEGEIEVEVDQGIEIEIDPLETDVEVCGGL